MFAVGISGTDGSVETEFLVKGLKGQAAVEVLDENRAIPMVDGVFKDAVEPWGVHLYRVTAPNPQ